MAVRMPATANPSHRIVRLSRRRRLEEDGGDTLFFVVHAGRRNGYLAAEDVPTFDGEEGWFELERIRKGPWMGWRVVRQVGKP